MKVSSVSSNRNVSDIVVHGLLGINNGVSMFFDSQGSIPLSGVYRFPHSLQKSGDDAWTLDYHICNRQHRWLISKALNQGQMAY